MDAAPWRGVRDAFLRLWGRQPRHAADDNQDATTTTTSPTVGVAGGGGGVPTVTWAADCRGGEGETEGSKGGAGGEGDGEGVEGEVCEAQDALDNLIRNRGYHVREHVPRRVLEHQVMANIRRRERIARILREEEEAATHSSPSHAPDPAPDPAPAPPTPPTPRPTTDRTQMISLLTKVWSGRGACVQERGRGEVEWAHSQFVLECVSEHNRWRALHNAEPLVLNEQLCLDAQSWANRLAHYGLLEYSSEHGRGENILTSTAKNLSGAAVVTAWYDTGRNFKYDVPGPADLAQAGPFSQVVWASTRCVGVGVARGCEGRTVVVCRYWPPGNLGGAFGTNVVPPPGEPRTRTPQGTPSLSRTRQESLLHVSYALEPPPKPTRSERAQEWLKLASVSSVRKAVATATGGGGEAGAGHNSGGAGPALAATLASCRNGAARTCRLVPVCCVPPRRSDEQWARPSARPDSRVTSQPAPATELLQLRLTPDTTRRPRPMASPKMGVQARLAGGSSRFAGCASPRCGSPRRASPLRAGVSSRRSAQSRVRAGSGVAVATL